LSYETGSEVAPTVRFNIIMLALVEISRGPALRLRRWGRDVLERPLELEFVDRALVVGAQAFSAVIPLFIVPASVGARDGGSLADYLLLARRVPWRRLVPQAALTATGMTVLSAGAVLYVPRAIESSATEFGAIGVAFTLLSLLWGAGLVLAIAAGIGAYLAMPTWSRASPGSVTPPSFSTSPARGS
jgi:hypothetical protein